jgi:putative transcriptional regulator
VIRHHPDSTLLLAHAAGRLDGGVALLVATHIEGCRRCAHDVQALEAIGGAELEAIEPAVMAPAALARTLVRIDGPEHEAPSRAAPASAERPGLPAGAHWPRSLDGCLVSGWRWLAPGIRWSRVALPHEPAGNVFLLRVGAGTRLPLHGHGDSEVTQVLFGALDDDRARFGQGDFDAVDRHVRHRPVVHAQGECVCLVSLQGGVRFDGILARLAGALVGL